MSAGQGAARGAGAAHDTRSLTVPASPSATARARGFVVEALRQWRVGSETVDDAEVVVSELVTNALLHGRATEVDVVLADHEAVVRLEVAHREPPSEAPTTLAPLTVAAEDTHGRGLAIVDVLASAWGVEAPDDRRRVWADLPSGRAGLLSPADRDGALTALADLLAAAPDARAVGHGVTAWAQQRLTTAFVGVALVAPDDPSLLQFVAADPPLATPAEARFPVAAARPAAAAHRHGQPYFHESRTAAVAHFPDLGPMLAAAGLAALADLPLLDGGTAVGTLAIAWDHGRVLDEGDRSWLAAVAAVATAALVRVGVARRDDAFITP